MQKVCPHCKSKRIKVRSGVYSIAEVTFENGEFNYNIISDESRVNDPYECAECGKQLTQADLVDFSVKCPKCGREVPPDKIVDGSCDICKLFEEQPDIQNMSLEDVLREFVMNKAESKTKKTTKVAEEKNDEPTKKKVTKKKKEDLPHVDVEATAYVKEEKVEEKKEEPKEEVEEETEEIKEELPKVDEPPMPSLDDFLDKPGKDEEKSDDEGGYTMFDPNQIPI